MKLLIDGVVFQWGRSGIARTWSALLPRLSAHDGLAITMLDRGDCPKFDGIERVEFPSYTLSYTAQDSLLIDQFCRDIEADVFVSTYYTSAVTTPQVLMVHDMVPEVMGFDPATRAWKEKQVALSYARFLACPSKSVRDDLERLRPEIPAERSSVVAFGIDQALFQPADGRTIEAWRSAHDVRADYFVWIGDPDRQRAYKNAALLFDAIGIVKSAGFDLVCLVDNLAVDQLPHGDLPRNVRLRHLLIDEAERAVAFSGARALVFPSLYEGFGMPILEAMACGCPVITTRHGALAEVAGDAALFVSGQDRTELLHALDDVQAPAFRDKLVRSGLKRAAAFDWDRCADEFVRLVLTAGSERDTASSQDFHRAWRKLRVLQAEVDVG